MRRPAPHVAERGPATALVEHYCACGCGRWGGWGYGPPLTLELKWYATECRPLEFLPGNAKPVPEPDDENPFE